jgi:hypothetical protein
MSPFLSVRSSASSKHNLFPSPTSSVGGGDEEDRTPDPLRARQVLSQLSYTPNFSRVGYAAFFPLYSLFEDPFSLWILKIKQCIRLRTLHRCNELSSNRFLCCLTEKFDRLTGHFSIERR